ncbi:MAG: orotidine-5'-phosphate decarboxylase [Acidimicrobiales bacterium]|nr:orotidine-5'-phosphate decarboxylase [Acidimicrobiales bacterium]RZV48735.1 MAG: orotidine-5'-phosphate decarboxylase [Acidimicrobiales bacterium]
MTDVSDELRSKLCVALDVDDLVEAGRLGRELRPWFGAAKVGLELFTAAGADAIGTLIEMGYDVFLDLKMYDIPTTVEKASRVLGALGVTYATYHAQGGLDVLKAGANGLREGASNAGLPEPKPLAITVLTSDAGAPEHIMPKRVLTAVEAGMAGLVCSADDVKEASHYAPRLLAVTPGIRPAGADAHDQARVATPKAAIEAGSDLLVIGRAVTLADDRVAAAESIIESILS